VVKAREPLGDDDDDEVATCRKLVNPDQLIP